MKLALRIVAVVVALLVVVAAGGWLYLRTSLPKTRGTVVLPGLRQSVDVVRDANDVPHIYAKDKADAIFALGYVHAQDRLWQMDFQRRVAAGRLSEVLGAATVDTDKFLRTLGVHRAAEAALATSILRHGRCSTPTWRGSTPTSPTIGVPGRPSTSCWA